MVSSMTDEEKGTLHDSTATGGSVELLTIGDGAKDLVAEDKQIPIRQKQWREQEQTTLEGAVAAAIEDPIIHREKTMVLQVPLVNDLGGTLGKDETLNRHEEITCNYPLVRLSDVAIIYAAGEQERLRQEQTESLVADA